MNKKQIEILFNMYEKLESDNEIVKKSLDILNPDNFNSFGYGFEIFNSFLEIIKIEDEVLYEWLEYFFYETGLGKNKLISNKDYSIKAENETFILKNKEDCINFLLENNYIIKD